MKKELNKKAVSRNSRKKIILGSAIASASAATAAIIAIEENKTNQQKNNNSTKLQTNAVATPTFTNGTATNSTLSTAEQQYLNDVKTTLVNNASSLSATDPVDLLNKVQAQVTAFNTQTNIASFGTISLANTIVQGANNVQVSVGTQTGDLKTGLKVVADIHFAAATGNVTAITSGDLFTNEVIYSGQSVTKSANEAELDKVTAVAATFTKNNNQTYVDSEFSTLNNWSNYTYTGATANSGITVSTITPNPNNTTAARGNTAPFDATADFTLALGAATKTVPGPKISFTTLDKSNLITKLNTAIAGATFTNQSDSLSTTLTLPGLSSQDILDLNQFFDIKINYGTHNFSGTFSNSLNLSGTDSLAKNSNPTAINFTVTAKTGAYSSTTVTPSKSITYGPNFKKAVDVSSEITKLNTPGSYSLTGTASNSMQVNVPTGITLATPSFSLGNSATWSYTGADKTALDRSIGSTNLFDTATNQYTVNQFKWTLTAKTDEVIYNGNSATAATQSINSSQNISVNPSATNKLLDTTNITIGDTISGPKSKNLTLAPSLTNNPHNLFKTTYTITKNSGNPLTGQTLNQVQTELNNNLYDPANNRWGVTKIEAVLAATASGDQLSAAKTKTLFDSTNTSVSKYIAAADVKFPATVTVSGNSNSLTFPTVTKPTGIEPYLRATISGTPGWTTGGNVTINGTTLYGKVSDVISYLNGKNIAKVNTTNFTTEKLISGLTLVAVPITGYTLEGYTSAGTQNTTTGAEQSVQGLSNVNNVISAADVTTLLNLINSKEFFNYSTSKSEKMVHGSNTADIKTITTTGLKPQYAIGTSANPANWKDFEDTNLDVEVLSADPTKRFMQIQLVPTSPTTLASGANGISAVTAKNDLSKIHTTVTFPSTPSNLKIDNGILTGAKSNALTAGSSAAFDIAANLSIPTNAPATDKAWIAQNLEIKYIVTNGANTTTYDAASLRTLFAGNIWDETNNTWKISKIEAEIQKTATADPYLDLAANTLKTQIWDSGTNNTPQIEKMVDATRVKNLLNTIKASGTHNNVGWTSSTLSANDAAQFDVEYLLSDTVTNIPGAAAPTTTGWTNALPTSASYTHANRHLFARIKPKSGWKLTAPNQGNDFYVDLTTSSGIAAVKSLIDNEQNYAAWLASTFNLGGNQNAAAISSVPTLPTGAKIMFSLDGTTFPYTQSAFEQTLRTAPFGTYESKNFKVRLEISDPNKYELTNDKTGVITTNSTYYAVTDVSAIDNIMPDTNPSISGNKTAIKLYGRLGQGNDVQIVLSDTALSESNLKSKGVTLQYQVVSNNQVISNNWIDFDYTNAAATANQKPAFLAASANMWMELKLDASDQLFFRLIPRFKEDKTTRGTITATTAQPSKDNVQQYADDVKVKTTVLAANQAIPTHQYDLDAVPVYVTAASSLLTANTSFKITPSGDTYNGWASNDSSAQSAIDTEINKNNTKPKILNGANWNTVIGIGYGVEYLSTDLKHYQILDDIRFVDESQLKKFLAGTTFSGTDKIYQKSTNTLVDINSLIGSTNQTLQYAGKFLTHANGWEMDWNNLDLKNFSVGWVVKDAHYVVSDSAAVKLDVSASVKKSIFLDTWLGDLKKVEINGVTNNWTVQGSNNTKKITDIQNELNTQFGTGTYKIEATPTVANNKGTWSTTPTTITADTNTLEINHDYDLAFRITRNTGATVNGAGTGGTVEQVLSSTVATSLGLSSATAVTEGVVWDKHTRANIKKFVHADYTKINASTGLVASGNTKSINFTTPAILTYVDKDGKLVGSNGTDALEIWYKISRQGYATGWMPESVFKGYLAGTYKLSNNTIPAPVANAANPNTGNTTAAYNYGITKDIVWDGKWGRDDIQVRYVAKTGYVIDSAQEVDTKPDVSAVTRWIDMDSIIAQYTSNANNNTAYIRVAPSATTGFLNTATGLWNASSTVGTTTWTNYIDNKEYKFINLPTSAIFATTAIDYKVKVEYSNDNGTTWNYDPSVHPDLDDTSTRRQLHVRFVPDGTYTSGELADFTDKNASKDLTTLSEIRNVPTRIDISNTDLTKVVISETTAKMHEDLTGVSIPTNSRLEYTLTDFLPIGTGANQNNNLASYVLPNSGATLPASVTAAYKPSMTFAELSTFAERLTTAIGANNPSNLTQFIRAHLKARVVSTSSSYAIKDTDDQALRGKGQINKDKLYTFVDVSSIAAFLKLASNNQGTDGILLDGAKDAVDANGTVIDGVRVSIMDSLYQILAKFPNLELQYKIEGQANNGTNPVTVNGTTPVTIDDPAKNWKTVTWAALPAKTTPINLTQVQHGFDIPLKTITKQGQASYGFLGFRIVPKQGDETQLTKTTPSTGTTDTLQSYYDATKTMLSVPTNTGATGGNVYNNYSSLKLDPVALYFNIDTSKIPKQVVVNGIPINTITIKGNTHDAIIDDAKGTNWTTGTSTSTNKGIVGPFRSTLLTKNNNDATLADTVNLFYTIDALDGTFNGAPTGVNPNSVTATTAANKYPLWLLEEDFEAYLDGKLKVAANGTSLTDGTARTFTNPDIQAAITARNLAANAPFTPNYTTIDTRDGAWQTGNGNNPARHNTVYVKWLNWDHTYTENSLFTPTEKNAVPLTYSETTFRRWFDGNYYNQKIALVKVKGNTKDASSYTFDYTAAPEVTDAALKLLGLKMQYSFDHNTWSDTKPDWSTQTWSIRETRAFYMRVVPENFTNQTLTNKLAESDYGLVVDYSKASAEYGTATTNSVTNGNNDFKTYINIDTSLLQASNSIKIIGNSIELVNQNAANTGSRPKVIDEMKVDNDTNEWSHVELQYLFRGKWYNQTDLLAEIAKDKAAAQALATAGTFTSAPDFISGDVKVRYRNMNPVQFEIKDEKTAAAILTSAANATAGQSTYQGNLAVNNTNEIATLGVPIDTTEFMTYVNIFDMQNISTTTANSAAISVATNHGTGVHSDFTNNRQGTFVSLSGSINNATITLNFAGAANPNWLTTKHLIWQYSTADLPSDDYSSTDWKSVQTGLTAQGIKIDAVSRRLWIRFIDDPTYTSTPGNNRQIIVSSTQWDTTTGKPKTVTPILIDTTTLKFEITNSSAVLSKLAFTGDTQDGFTVDESPFLNPTAATQSGGAGSKVEGINRFYSVDSSGNEKEMSVTDAQTFIKTTAGITIRYRIKQNRYGQTYTNGLLAAAPNATPVATSLPGANVAKSTGAYGEWIEFENLADLQAALKTHQINFNWKDIQASWNLKNTAQYQFSDNNWVSLDVNNNFATIANLKTTVYTDDVFMLTNKTMLVQGNDIKIPAPTPAANTTPEGKDTGKRGVNNFADVVFASTTTNKVIDWTYLKTLGLRLQFNITALNGQPDPNKWENEAPDTGLNANKDYWIRYAPDANLKGTFGDLELKLANGAPATSGSVIAQTGGEQITRIDVSNVKHVIPIFTNATLAANAISSVSAGNIGGQPIKYNNAAEIRAAFAKVKLTGTTFDFTYDLTTGNELPPVIPTTVQNNVSGAHLQYSIDGNLWSDTITGALSNSDAFGVHVNGFIKDRGDKLYIRYVYKAQTGTLSNAPVTWNDPDYVFTDASGNNLSQSDLQFSIDITNLTEPVFTTATLGKLTGQTSIKASGAGAQGATRPLVQAGTTNDEFANITWQYLAKMGLFKPRFIPGSNDKVATYQYMWYDSTIRDANNPQKWIFELQQNAFNNPNATNTPTPSDLNAMAPLHTHFEFQIWDAATSNFIPVPSNLLNSQTNLPTDLTKDTNNKHFRVILVADSGYSLDDTLTAPTAYLDKSAPSWQTITNNSQKWHEDYSVVVELATSNISPVAGSTQAEYIGFNDPVKPRGIFKTNDVNGDHSPAMSGPLKDILVNFVNGTTPIDFVNQTPGTDDGRAYVLEWKVTNNGADISWTDSRNQTWLGWHPAVVNPNNPTVSDVAPDDKMPWYGAYPVSLKNGDVIVARLRARDGYVITNDTNSSDYEKGKQVNGQYELKNSKTSRWSHDMSFNQISGLPTQIKLPQDYIFIDQNSLVNYNGVTFNDNTLMPHVAFSGFEGAGKVTVTIPAAAANQYKVEATVLRPYIGSGLNQRQSYLDSNQVAGYGYILMTTPDQFATLKPGATTTIPKPTLFADLGTTNGSKVNYGWAKDWEKDPTVTWVDPSTINDLSVGDVLLFRLVANANFAFEWDDPDTPFDDTNYPKPKTDEIFGSSAVQNVSSLNSDLTFYNPTNHDVHEKTPLQVRGLTVRPTFDLNTLQIVYSTDPKKNLDTQGEVTLNNIPDTYDVWHWRYHIIHNGVAQSPLAYDSLGIQHLSNGDVIVIDADTKDASYKLDPAYNNTAIQITVTQLRTAASAQGVGNPAITIGGYEAHGKIETMFDHAAGAGNIGAQWQTATPAEPFGHPNSNNVNDQLEWQYQVYHSDPRLESDINLATAAWSNTIPDNLSVGDWVRVRVGSVDPTRLALDNNMDYVYSINPNYVAPTVSAGQTLSTSANSWFEVTGLKLNPVNIDYTGTIDGFIKKTVVTFTQTNSTSSLPDSYAIKAQFSVDGGQTWLSDYDKQTMQSKLTGLINGDIVKLRVVANKGYVFDPNDPSLAANPKWEIKLEKDLDPQATGNVWYLYKDTWQVKADGLKKYLKTETVTIDPLTYTNMDQNNVNKVDSNGNPWPVDPATGKLIIATDKNGNTQGVHEGFAMLNPVSLQNLQTVTDINNNTQDATATPPLDYQTLVQVQYTVRRVDIYTGKQKPDEILAPGKLPEQLNNGDVIMVDLISSDPQYLLSNPKHTQITVSGLVTIIDEEVYDPTFTFDGASGKGSIANITTAPRRTQWVYSVIKQPAPNAALPDYNDPAYIKDSKNWIDEPPTTLENGDYVVARLVPSVAGASGLVVKNMSHLDTNGQPTNVVPVSSKWVMVSGLAQKIDLSRYQFNLYDKDHPYDPAVEIDPTHKDPNKRINFAFKLDGDQEGIAAIAVNAPIFDVDLTHRLVDKYGNYVPDAIAQVLQWEFAVNNNESPDGDYQYSATLPNGLKNGQYIHVRLGIKNGVKDTTVTGFKKQVFQIDGLKAPASVSSKIITLLGVSLGGIGILGAVTGIILLLRKRRKKLHFSGKF